MYTIGGELYHHGVLGMKWGVRRYQPYSQGYNAKNKGNFTGKLTDKQTKKYYEKDKYNTLRLNKKGQKENAKKEKRIQNISDATYYNITKVKKEEFNKKFEEYKKLKEEDHNMFEEEHQKFLNNDKKYKNMDYYDFKDKVSDDWYNSENFKKQKQVREELHNMVEDAAKQHPLYDKNYWVFETYSFANLYNKPVEMVNKNIGKEVVNKVMYKIDKDSDYNERKR